MGMGYLHGMREHWRETCKGLNQNPYQQFLDTLGDRAEYKHLAIDSYRLGSKREYGTQPYAVFEYRKDAKSTDRRVFTITDLEALANHAKTHRLPGVRRHMTEQLALALRDYEANKMVIEDLSPMRNRPRTVFAR